LALVSVISADREAGRLAQCAAWNSEVIVGRGADRPEPAGTEFSRIRPPPSVGNMRGLRGAASRHAVRFPTDGKRAHPSQGEGRAQIVVEPKQELPFEIARGSQGGAAEGVAGNRHKTDWPSHFVKVRY
jgi:hypothetical protein